MRANDDAGDSVKSFRQQGIVVGVDGSAASVSALRWAADEARLRASRLRIVRAWEPVTHAAPYAGAGRLASGDEQETRARSGFSATLRAEFGPRLPDGVTAELVVGRAERILIARSADADMLVLGETSRVSRAGRSAGPVIRSCVMHARCPVVVVGSADPDSEPKTYALSLT
jgi:nucleotide-binding universal stress UspA family protein